MASLKDKLLGKKQDSSQVQDTELPIQGVDFFDVEKPKGSIFFIDFDNTLLYTDLANNLAYLEAIHKECKHPDEKDLFRSVIEDSKNYRIFSTDIYDATFNATEFEEDLYKNIIERKEKEIFFRMSNSEPHHRLLEFITLYKTDPSKIGENYKSYLVTSGKRRRVLPMLMQFDLEELFDGIIYCNHKNKYESTEFKDLITSLKSQNSRNNKIFTSSYKTIFLF